MQGWFRIEADRRASLIRLTMGGFFDSATIGDMRAQLVTAIGSLTCPPNEHLTLCDIRGMDIQTQDRVEEFSRLVGSDDVRSRRLAFVTARSLARLQAKRLSARADVEFFSDLESAHDWLTG